MRAPKSSAVPFLLPVQGRVGYPKSSISHTLQSSPSAIARHHKGHRCLTSVGLEDP